MKTTLLKQSIAMALLSLASFGAHAQSITFNFDYLAQANTASNLSTGASFASLSPTAVSAGNITFTDLSDLNLGDGKTGVRISVNLTNLNQFSSGHGTRYSNSIEFSFPGTGAGTGGVEYITSAVSLRNVNGAQFTTGGDGGIEWDEHGSVGNGTINTATSGKWAFFQQQNNFVVGSFQQGGSVVFDYLNGDTLSGGADAGSIFNGFSVANLTSVANQKAGIPNAYAWLRVRSIDDGIQKTGQWFDPYLQVSTNATTGVTTETLQILATTAAVPEPSSWGMILAGLGMMGYVAKRRKA